MQGVQIVLDGALPSDSVVPFVKCLLRLEVNLVCMYGNDLCQTKEDELGAKYQLCRPTFPLAAILARVRVPPLFCLPFRIFSGSPTQWIRVHVHT